MVVIHHVLTSLHPTLSSHTWKDECVWYVSMSSSIRSSLRRDQLHVCSIFELVARLYMCKGGCNFRVRNADKAEVRLPYKLA